MRTQLEPGQNCAYNHTRGCFIGLHVVAGEFSPVSLLDWILTLQPGSGAGIWMIPFRGMPGRELRTPVDLLYLDANCRVLEAVELYPTFRVSPGCAPAASVLALPPNSIVSTRAQAGDQLLLCPNEEVKWRLEQLVETGSVGAAAAPLPARPSLRPVLVREQPVRSEPAAVVNAALEKAPQTPALNVVTEAPAIEAICPEPTIQEPSAPLPLPDPPRFPSPPREPPPIQAKPWLAPERQPALSPLARLSRWLMSEPRDPRSDGRRPVEGLVAHFFTGGAPQEHAIRDISSTGLYVVTSERWYPGTIVRMTLSKPDVGQAPSERSITIQTRAVRWGNDGVGLEFLVESPKAARQYQPEPLGGVSGKQLQRFLSSVPSPAR